jgi:hypothetical protein
MTDNEGGRQKQGPRMQLYTIPKYEHFPDGHQLRHQQTLYCSKFHTSKQLLDHRAKLKDLPTQMVFQLLVGIMVSSTTGTCSSRFDLLGRSRSFKIYDFVWMFIPRSLQVPPGRS